MFDNPMDNKVEAARRDIHALSDAELRQNYDQISQMLREGNPQLEDFERLILYKDELQRRLWLEDTD